MPFIARIGLVISSFLSLILADFVHLPARNGYHMVEQSPPQWIKLGDAMTLTCKTSQPWTMCRWIAPNGQSCDRRSSEVYDTNCEHDPRLKFQMPDLSKKVQFGTKFSDFQIQQLKTQCTLHVEKVSWQDHGAWQCLATQDPFSRSLQSQAETKIETFVLSPYSIEIDARSQTIHSLINATIQEEITCKSRGKSQIKPQIQWMLQGEILDQDSLSISTQEESDDQGFIILSQTIQVDQKLLEHLAINSSSSQADLEIGCSAIQRFPNGSTIYRSAVQETFHLAQTEEDLDSEDEMGTNIAGLIVVIIIGILVFAIILLLCIAQRKKVTFLVNASQLNPF